MLEPNSVFLRPNSFCLRSCRRSPKRQMNVCSGKRLVKCEIAFNDSRRVKEPETKRIATMVLIKPCPGRPGHVHSACVAHKGRANLSYFDFLHYHASVCLHQAERNLRVVMRACEGCTLFL